MESRDAHANLSRDFFDAQWLGEILTQFLDGSDYAMSLSSNRGEMAHAMSLFADKQAIDNFPNNQRTKYPILLGHLKQPYQAQAGIEQIRIKRADGNGLDAVVLSLSEPRFYHGRSHHGGIEDQAQSQVGFLRRSHVDLAYDWQSHCADQIVIAVVSEAVFS